MVALYPSGSPSGDFRSECLLVSQSRFPYSRPGSRRPFVRPLFHPDPVVQSETQSYKTLLPAGKKGQRSSMDQWKPVCIHRNSAPLIDNSQNRVCHSLYFGFAYVQFHCIVMGCTSLPESMDQWKLVGSGHLEIPPQYKKQEKLLIINHIKYDAG